jgi:apolipoprotein D and lipocalin family protein
MIPPDRPRGEYRCGKHEGTQASMPGQTKSEHPSAQHRRTALRTSGDGAARVRGAPPLGCATRQPWCTRGEHQSPRRRGRLPGRLHAVLLNLAVASASLGTSSARSQTAPMPIDPLPSLDVSRYLGTWYQVALYPNRFQAQCVSDTTATYRLRSDNAIAVLNRCLDTAGQPDEAAGLARPIGTLVDGTLRPAQLEVSFLPAWLRWAQAIGNWGWGAYWVIQLAPDYRYAVVSEGTRQFLWVLSRTPALAAGDETTIRSRLAEQGFDLTALQMHPHGETPLPSR